MSDQPLSGVKVLDLTHHIAGPYSTKMMADFGAEVIKVERPDGGDVARRMGPFPGDIPHPEKSGLFLHLNTNKLGITLNLRTETGQKIVKELVKEADILVENFRPGVMASWGLSYEELAAINPNLIMTSISNFGQTGPYRDYAGTDLVLFAMGGKMNRNGLPGRPPLRLAANQHLFQAGNCGAMATMFAFYGREYQGNGGEYIDISILETQLASFNTRMSGLLQYQYTKERAVRVDQATTGFPNGFYPCQDGYVNIRGGLQFWDRIVDLLDMPELLHDPRFATSEGQADSANKDLFEATIWLPWLMEHTKTEAIEAAQSKGILSGALNTIDEVVSCPQFVARQYFVEVDHPVAGNVRQLGAHFKNADNWWQVRRPAPLLGQHNEEIYCGRLGYAKEDLVRLTERGVI